MNKVVVLEGNVVECKGELDKIKRTLADYELFSFDEEDDIDYVSQIISEISCFGQYRLFIIKRLPSIEAPDLAQARVKVLGRFKKLFPSIPNGNLVVFKNVGLSAESFFKEVKKYGEVHNFDKKMSKSDAKSKVRKFLERRKIIFEPEAVDLIVDSLNIHGLDVNIDKLYILIRKIYNYVAGKNKITKEDAYSVCDTSKDFIIWTFYNLLDEKDPCSSLDLITDHLENVKNFQVESTLLIQSMVWRYGLLLLAKQGVNEELAKDMIAKKISDIIKLEAKGRAWNIKMSCKLKEGKIAPEYSTNMINSTLGMGYNKSPLPFYSFEQLLLIYYVLVKILIKIRSGCTDAEIRIAFHIAILAICGKINKKNTIDGVLEHKKALYRRQNGRNI